MTRAVETAEDVGAALATRHARDVFVPECNLGSAWHGCRRMDAWAMSKSWSPWTTFGYEVKVARSDFLNDRKWHQYLPVCHEFYVACPAKLVAPEELPSEVGLLWFHGGSRLVCKRRAVRRPPDPERLLQLMAYVLMSRTRVVASMQEANDPLTGDPRARWAAWLAEDDGKRWLGHMVSRRLAERVHVAERRAQNLEAERVHLAEIRERVRSWGLDPDRATAYDLERRFAPDVGRDRQIRTAAQRILRVLEDGSGVL